jgi:hypothetical protein
MHYDLQEVISDLTKAIETGGEQYRLMAREDAPFENIRSKDLFRAVTGSFDRVSNVDSNGAISIKAKKHILREICKKYMETSAPTFTLEDIQERLRGYDPRFIATNLKELLSSSGLVESHDKFSFKLTRQGKKSCRKGELLD